MFRVSTLIFALALAAPAFPSPAEAAPRQLGQYRDWTLWTADLEGEEVCYIASVPKSEDGNYARRGPAAVLVMYRAGSEQDEVSVQSGYEYADDSEVSARVDDNTFSLFTQGEHAWADTSEEDAALIDAMRAGSDMTVRGTSTRDTYSEDTYSLLGFTAAYEALGSSCS